MRRRFNLESIDLSERGEGITFNDAFKFNDNIFLKRVTYYVTRENYRYICKIFIEVRSDCTIRTKGVEMKYHKRRSNVKSLNY